MIKQMGGERMTQHMRRHYYFYVHPPGGSLDDLPKSLSGHFATMMVEKQRIFRCPSDNFRPGPVQVVQQSILR